MRSATHGLRSAFLLVVLLCVGAVTGTGSARAASTRAASSRAAATRAASSRAAATRAAPTAGTDYYLSLGDSYAAGYQPVVAAFDGRDAHGFAYQVVGRAAAKGYHFTLRNYGCSGATTSSILREVGCSQPAAGPDTESYPTESQATAAGRFLSRHKGQIGLITVSIGGNDIIACGEALHPLACFAAAMPGVKRNLTLLLAALRRAAGPTVPIVGLTYPDIFLGLDTSADPTDKADAALSVTGFRHFLNPTLHAAYSAAGGDFVDVTGGTGAYTPWTHTTHTIKYGIIPVAVADVCSLTYFCRNRDAHPTTPGYADIARMILRTLPSRV
jgi:lysophospholipase L1-like esterase